AVLAVKDVAHVAVETGEPQRNPVALEDPARAPRRRKRLRVPAERYQALQGAIERTGHVDIPPRPAEHLRRRVITGQGVLVLAGDVADVTGGSQRLRAAA